jgi:hypothetical protein
MSGIRRHAENAGLDHPLIARLADGLIDRARRCAKLIDMVGEGD